MASDSHSIAHLRGCGGRPPHHVTFSTEADFYTATRVNQILSTDSAQLRELRHVGALEFEALPGEARTIARYEITSVHKLRDRLDSSVTLRSASVKLGVPVYALTQLVELGILDADCDPTMLLMRGAAQIRTASVELLNDSLVASARHAGNPPLMSMKLKHALARFPGEKPYGKAISLMLNRKLKYFANSPLNLRDFLIDKKDLVHLKVEHSVQHLPDSLTTVVSLENAIELLGTKHAIGMAAIQSAGLAISSTSKGKGVTRSELLCLARQIAFTGEAAAATGIHSKALSHEFDRLQVPRVHGGWCRQTLVELGFVQNLEFDSANVTLKDTS